MRRLVPFALLLGVLFAAADGAFLGTRLARAVTRPGHEDVVIAAPALAAGPRPEALVAPGGFTGFGGAPALGGDVFRAGTVASVDGAGQTLVIQSQGSTATLRYTSTVRFFRLQPLVGSLTPGDLVVVRYQGDQPAGVMRVPADLEQGVGTSQTPHERGLPVIPPP
jgi:hypothetical protein